MEAGAEPDAEKELGCNEKHRKPASRTLAISRWQFQDELMSFENRGGQQQRRQQKANQDKAGSWRGTPEPRTPPAQLQNHWRQVPVIFLNKSSHRNTGPFVEAVLLVHSGSLPPLGAVSSSLVRAERWIPIMAAPRTSHRKAH